MNHIEHLIEPQRLFLVWQKPDGNGEARGRRIVAELVRPSPIESVTFRYLKDTKDFQKAEQDGFKGFPAFGTSTEQHSHSPLAPFIRRIPPRSREDFSRYLAMHKLPSNYTGSDFALLGYTNAKLPGDGFELIPDLSGIEGPFEFMLEVAGTQYHNCPIDNLVLGDTVNFVIDQQNEFDSNAICIFSHDNKLGHVPRPYLPAFHDWISRGIVSATIERLNGKPERRLIYLFVSVK